MKLALRLWLCLVFSLPLQAKLVWEETAITRTVPPNVDEVGAQFVFRNSGGDTIEIVDVKTSCGCTTAVSGKHEYKPGEEGSIDATLSVGSLAGDTMTKKIYVRYREKGETKVDELSISAYAPEYVRQSRKALSWDHGMLVLPQRVIFSVVHHEPIHLREVVASRSGFTFELKTIAPGRKYELIVAPEPNATSPSYATLEVLADFPPEKPFVYQVQARLQPNRQHSALWYAWRQRLVHLLF